MNKLFSNLVLTYSASVFGFSVSILSARMLGAVDYAWMAFGLAVAGFLIPILNLGNERTFVRDAVAIDHEAGVGEMVNASFTIRILLTLFFAITLAIASWLFTDTLADTVAMFSISLWASLLGLYPASWYDYLNEIRTQNFIVLLERISSLILIGILFILPDDFHLAWLVGTSLLVLRIIFIAIQVTQWWKIFGKARFRWLFPTNFFAIGGVNYRVASALFFNAVLIYGNQILLSDYGDKAELASYGLAFQVMSLIFIFQGLGIRLISCKIAETCATRIGVFQSILKYSILLAFGSAVLALIAWVGIKYLPILLADSRYELMNKFSLILCTWVVIAGVGQVITQHSMALHQESIYLVMAIVGGISGLLLGVKFVPLYGGMAVASILLCVHSFLIITEMSRIIFVMKN